MLLAILLGEDDAHQLARAIASDGKRLVGVVSALEASVVIESRLGPSGGRELDLLLHRARIDVAGMNREQWEIARGAYRRFGKGRHPAGLNLGDCCSYALACYSREPLLFKGSDFPQTDVPAYRLPQ